MGWDGVGWMDGMDGWDGWDGISQMARNTRAPGGAKNKLVIFKREKRNIKSINYKNMWKKIASNRGKNLARFRRECARIPEMQGTLYEAKPAIVL